MSPHREESAPRRDDREHGDPVAMAVLYEYLDTVYKPAGVNQWVTAKHRDWQLTVTEMAEAGRFGEVLAKAEALTHGQVAT